MPNTSSLRPEWDEITQRDFRAQYKSLASLPDLARFWGIPPRQLSYYAYHIDKRKAYRTFFIPRRNGGKRKIDGPSRTLKYIQRIIHESLTRIYGPHPAVHGFVPNKSIVTNAKRHLGRQYVLNIDLADFFPSITRKRIYGRLVEAPYSFHREVAIPVATLATNACSQLPQGSPSSPVIANMVAAELDADLAKLCRLHGCWYTRYADDITISTASNEMPPPIAKYPSAQGTGQVVVGDRLMNIIEKHGFKLNHRKSRLHSYWTRQTCTGLVVNGDRVTPPRPYIRNLRSLIYHWQKNGWEDAAQVLYSNENRPLFEDRQRLLNHVIGKINYLKMVRGQDDPIAQRMGKSVAYLP